MDIGAREGAPLAEGPVAIPIGGRRALVPAPLIIVVGEDFDGAAGTGRAVRDASGGIGVNDHRRLDAIIGIIAQVNAETGVVVGAVEG